MMLEIHTDAHYQQAMAVTETYLDKGSGQLTEVDLAELKRLSLLIETYENIHYPIPLAFF